MSSSVAGRLPRVNTKEAIRYKDKIIPINVSDKRRYWGKY